MSSSHTVNLYIYWLKKSSKDSTEFTFSLLYLALLKMLSWGTCVSGIVNLRSLQCYELSYRS